MLISLKRYSTSYLFTGKLANCEKCQFCPVNVVASLNFNSNSERESKFWITKKLLKKKSRVSCSYQITKCNIMDDNQNNIAEELMARLKLTINKAEDSLL